VRDFLNSFEMTPRLVSFRTNVVVSTNDVVETPKLGVSTNVICAYTVFLVVKTKRFLTCVQNDRNKSKDFSPKFLWGKLSLTLPRNDRRVSFRRTTLEVRCHSEQVTLGAWRNLLKCAKKAKDFSLWSK